MQLAALLAVFATLVPHVQDPAAPPPDPPCRLFGVFVDEAGAPIDGVSLSVSGRQGNAERAKRFGLPQSWQNPALVTTGDDGKFSVSFVPPRAFQFSVDASAPGLGRVAWRWGEIEPGKELDLGTVTLEPEGILIGHIVDAAGNLQVEGWRVSATHNRSGGIGGRDSVMARATIDPTTGQFRIEGLPPGALQVDASSGTTRIGNVTVTTKKGEETFLELRYSGPDPERRLVVMLRSRPFLGVRPDPGTVHAIAADGTRHTLTQVPTSNSEWHVVDIEPGEYRVEVRDPRFVPAAQEGVRTGVPATVSLIGSATLRLAVVDGDTGAPVEDYHLDVSYRSPGIGSNVVRFRERKQPMPPGGSYAGMLPGDLSLAVEAEGWPIAHLDVDALAAGETRDVRVTLVRGMALRGRVVDTQGGAMAGIAVQVTRGAYPGHDRLGAGEAHIAANVDGQQVRARIGYRDDATTTAEDGSFAFEGLGPGTHALLALHGPSHDVWTTVELPCAEPVELTMPDAALVSVRLRLPEGESSEGLALELLSAPGQLNDTLRRVRRSTRDEVWSCGADGLFPARNLPLGPATLVVAHPMDGENVRGYQHILRHEISLDRAGARELEVDLRESYPTKLTLHTRAPKDFNAGRMEVHFITEEGERVKDTNGFRRTEDGRAIETRWVAPGVYRVEVTGQGIRWSRPEPVHVVRGSANVLELDLPLVEREVRVLGPDGAPLANTTVAYWTDSEHRAVGTTDRDGALAVVLLVGTLSIAVPREPDPTPEPNPALGGRTFRTTPKVDPAVLAGLTARATAAFVPGERPLDVRLRPE